MEQTRELYQAKPVSAYAIWRANWWRRRRQPRLIALMLDLPAIEIPEDERNGALHTLNQRLVLAGAASAVSAGALFVPALNIPGILLIGYCIVDLGSETATTIARTGRLRANLLQTLAVFSMTALGYPYLGATSLLSYYAGLWLVDRNQTRTLQQLARHLEEAVNDTLRLESDDAGRVTEVSTPLQALRVGDVVRVYGGHTVPVDGVVVGGAASVDQHQLTGESRPVDVYPGDAIMASGTVLSGYLDIRTERTGDSILAEQIQHLLREAQEYRKQVQTQANHLADITVVPTLLLAAGALGVLGVSAGFNMLLANNMNQTRFAVAISLFSYLDAITRSGVFIKDGRALELLTQVDTVVFDKTGTLTLAQPVVYAIHRTSEADADENTLLAWAAAIEAHQQHPIAQAIRQAAQERDLTPPQADDTTLALGSGIEARIQGRTLRLGSERMMRKAQARFTDELQALQAEARSRGNSTIYMAEGERIISMIELEAPLRPNAAEVVADLRKRGLEVVLMSGDDLATSQRVAESLGIDHVIAEVLPQDKGRLVEEWQAQGRSVCFVGDGINDALALKTAHVSVAMHGATVLAADTAQVVLLKDQLALLPYLLRTAHQYQRDIVFTGETPIAVWVLTAGGVALGLVDVVGNFVITIALSSLTGIGAARPRLFAIKRD